MCFSDLLLRCSNVSCVVLQRTAACGQLSSVAGAPAHATARYTLPLLVRATIPLCVLFEGVVEAMHEGAD